MATPRWGGLRPEPYDPDARDADGDGIVQEQTAWERPVGTQLVDELGRPITRGARSGTRPRGMRVVDKNGRDVDYTPTYGTAPAPGTSGRGTALSDHGAGSLKERGVPSLSEISAGLAKREAPNVRAISDPRPPEADAPEVDAPEERNPIAIPDNPEFHGVTRLDANGNGNPKWARLQEWANGFGITLRGTPVKWDDERIPDTLYHVSPAIQKIREDGVLKALGTGGLGGDDKDRIVSMTTQREVAEQILNDMRLVRDVGRAQTPDEVLDVLRADAGRYGIDLSERKASELRAYAERGSHEALNSYLWTRDSLGGPANPLFFDLKTTMPQLAKLSDDDFGIVEVSKSDLDNGALITDFDLGEGHLEEVRSYGDVKIDINKISTPSPADTPETPDVKPSRPNETKKPPEEVVPEGLQPSGLTSASTDRPELVEPTKPRSPFKPSPPPLAGRAQEIADEADGDFGRFMELLNKEGFVVFDYETTGLQDGNIPVQIGAVRIKDGEIVERLNLFTNPRRPLSDWSKENLKDKDGNPLTDEWLSNQMDLAEAHKQLADFMGDSIIVAHNLPYDGEIIERMMKDGGIEHNPSGSIDTLMLLRSAVPKGDGESGPERHTLGSLADFFNVDLGDDAHTADADSEAAALVLQRAMGWASRNDSDPEIFDAKKQKELFDAATTKYEAQRKQYDEDLKKYRADMEDYQRALAKAAEPEVQPDTTSYQMSHQPNDDGPRAHDLTENEWLTDDVYAHPERYTGADAKVRRETMAQLRAAKGDPDAKVTIYRYAPEGADIQAGNWVSLSRTYAEQHGESNPVEGGQVISMEVPAKEVRFAGDDLAEFGWFPSQDRASAETPDTTKALKADMTPADGDLDGEDSFAAGSTLTEGVINARAEADQSWRDVDIITSDGRNVKIRRDLTPEPATGFIDQMNADAPENKMQNAREVGARMAQDLSVEELNDFLPGSVVTISQEGIVRLAPQRQAGVPINDSVMQVDPSTNGYKELLAEAVASNLIEGWATMGGAEELHASVSRVFGSDDPVGGGSYTELDDLRRDIIEDAKRQKIVDAMARATYENTQRRLQEQGITEMVLHRGMFLRPESSDLSRYLFSKKSPDRTEFQEDLEVALRPISSFSFNIDTAQYSFGEYGSSGGTLISTVVPAERIFSLALTGFGCYEEDEIMVIGGGNISARVRWTLERGSTDGGGTR